MTDRPAGRASAPGLLLGVLVALLSCGGPPPDATTGDALEARPASPAPPLEPAAYETEIEEWRTRRLEGLTSDGGWLTVVGLHWLRQGENPFGTSPEGRIVLPEASAPDRAGRFLLEGDRIFLVPGGESEITLEGKPVTARIEVKADDPGPPDVLKMRDLTLYVIKRDERYGLRVKDPGSPARRDFSGLEYFPVDPALRLEATFVPYDPPRIVEVPNVLGSNVPMPVPGEVRFTVGGQELTLEPVAESVEEDFFFIFRDGTSGKETYGGGRFLYSDPPRDGKVILDFNKAYNPPCAFTAYATCPLPPPQNRLAVRLEAGEKTYGKH